MSTKKDWKVINRPLPGVYTNQNTTAHSHIANRTMFLGVGRLGKFILMRGEK